MRGTGAYPVLEHAAEPTFANLAEVSVVLILGKPGTDRDSKNTGDAFMPLWF
jgi:hypothetical protein